MSVKKMAALAETHRQVERRDVDQECHERIRAACERVDHPDAEHRGNHRDQPRDYALLRLSRVE